MKLAREARLFWEVFMKKLIPFISPLVCGIFSGLLIECVMSVLSVVISPFYDSAQTSILFFLILIALLSALFIALMMLANIAYLVNLNNSKRAKLIAVLEMLAFIVIFFAAWNLCNPIVRKLPDLLLFSSIK